jgi:hypothetical protein
MTLPAIAESPPSAQNQSPVFGRNLRRALDLIATAFWLYALAKLFVFDFDVYVVQTYAPTLHWLLQLRFIILVALAGLSFLLFKKSIVIGAVFYIAFFPLVVLFWKLPILMFRQKSWTLAFALANSGIHFFKNIKQLAITSALFFVSATTILVSTNIYLIASSGGLLLILITVSFVKSLASVFRRSDLPGIYALILNAWREAILKKEPISERIHVFAPDQLSTEDRKIWSSALETRVLFNRACLFIARRFRAYQQSRLNVASGVFTSLTLLTMTVISFAFINMAAFAVTPAAYATHGPTLFDFFHYSFKTFVFGSTKEVEAIAPISEILNMVENFFALFLGVIFASLVISVRSQRHSEELDQVIRIIEKQGKTMEIQIAREYKIKTIDDALSELERASAGMIKVLYWLSNN